MKRTSGNHLGVVRSWMQWNARNGDQVTWGSNEPLNITRALTPRRMEMLAQDICDGVVKDMQSDIKPLQRIFARLKPLIEKGITELSGDESASAGWDLFNFEAKMKALLDDE